MDFLIAYGIVAMAWFTFGAVGWFVCYMNWRTYRGAIFIERGRQALLFTAMAPVWLPIGLWYLGKALYETIWGVDIT